MSAYLVVTLHMQDPSWVKDYVANVPAILRSHGGEYLAVSETLKQFEGEGEAPDQVALFTFPSLEAIEEFMESPEYRPYRDARIKGSHATIVGLQPQK